MDELHYLTLTQVAAGLQQKKLSPVELTEACLKRIQAQDAQLSCFITLTAELAMERAKKAEAEIAAGRLRSPLHGIPIALKDLYATKGICPD